MPVALVVPVRAGASGAGFALVRKLPRLLDLHAQGLIGELHVRAAVEATFGLDAAVIGKVEERVLGRAGSQTPALFRASLRRAVAAKDARSAEQRHAEARIKEKTVRLCPLPDGMAGIWSVHTAVDAEAIYARLRELTATTSPGDARGDQRGVDERRADALRDLVLGNPAGGSGSASRVHVQLLIPAAVAAGFSDAPGELVGYGPIPASLCRDAMQQPGTTIERIHLDHDGQVIAPADIDSDRDRYRPSARMQRYLHAQWPTCRFPGCNRRALRCETDHIVAFDGTNTIRINLQPLCPRHHHLKHEAGWAVTRRDDGVTEWTSPTGRHYDKPPDERPPPPR